MSAEGRRGRATDGPTPAGGDATFLDGFRRQILAWVREGLSDQQIAEHLRVSRSMVRSWRERNDVGRPPRGEGGGDRGPSGKGKGKGKGKRGA